MATAKEIWDTLSKIDVSDHIEKKGGLSYLSWAWAWGVLMEHYPEAHYVFGEDTIHPDGSVTTMVSMTIGDTGRSMMLPVMDNRNNSIFGPTSRQISDTRMRCLVKCIAMFGLGHYIYAGEDVPQEAAKEQTQPQQPPVSHPQPMPPPEQPQASWGDPPPQPIAPGSTQPAPPTAEHIDTPQAAAEVRSMLAQMAGTFCETDAQLREFWHKNRASIEILRTQYPDEYKALAEVFQQIKAQMG